MAKILVISDDGSASAEVVDAALDGEEPWSVSTYCCHCTAVRAHGDLATTVLAAAGHLDHHRAHRPVQPPVVGG